MNRDAKHLQWLLASLNRLLEKAGDDELLKFSLNSRIEQTESEIGKLTDIPGTYIPFNAEEILKAADKLDKRVAIDDDVVMGLPLGVTLETGHFDFEKDDGIVLSGYVSDELDEDELVEIQKRFRIRSKATIETTTITNPDATISRTHVLLRIDDLAD